jgi:tripartite-type tricarboxylate transporter receptor subunit TctC
MRRSINVPNVIQHVKAGKLRARALTSKEFSMFLPVILTFTETGFPSRFRLSFIRSPCAEDRLQSQENPSRLIQYADCIQSK